GIGTIAHAPEVGRNLRDHLSSVVTMRTQNTDSYGLSARALPRGLWNVLEYLLAHRGPLASNVFEAHGFIRSSARRTRPSDHLHASVSQPFRLPNSARSRIWDQRRAADTAEPRHCNSHR